jgi:histidyl-tRNA synthetase
MYTFEDAGGRSLTLRPEGTAPVCRAYLEHGMHTLAQPVKLWYLGSYYRQEKPQAGRFRQFWQLGCEAIGSDDPAVDAEAIALLHRCWASSTSAGCACAWARWAASTRARVPRAPGRLPARARRPAVGRRARAHRPQPAARLRRQGPGTQAVMREAPLLLGLAQRRGPRALRRGLRALRVAGIDWELDGTLVRGIDYYTRTIFEFTSDALGAQSGVAGGGRYDG